MTPSLDDDARLFEAVEDLAIEQLIPELAPGSSPGQAVE